jgi:hypothetical protein
MQIVCLAYSTELVQTYVYDIKSKHKGTPLFTVFVLCRKHVCLKAEVKVEQSHYRPGEALSVPGS